MSYSFNNLTLSGALDSTGTLNIGTSTATAINFGKAGVTTTFPGPISTTQPANFDDIDTSTPKTMLIGKSTATKVEIADAGVTTEIQGPLTAANIDTSATLTIGSTTATKVELGRSGQDTEVKGTLTINNPSTALHATTKNYVDTLSTTGVLTSGSISSTFGPLVVQNLAAPPANTEGGIYYDTDDKKLLFYNGTVWGELGGGGGGGSTGILSNFKFQHENNGIVTVSNFKAVKTQDSITLFVPSFSVTTANTGADIVSNLLTLGETLPIGTTIKQNKIIVVNGEATILRLEIAGSSWYYQIHKLSAGNWSAGPKTVESFELTYQTTNTTALSAGPSNYSSTDPYTPPMVIVYSPAVGVTCVSTTTNLVLTFNETVVKGTGDIRIKSYTGDTLFETIPVSATTLSTTTVTNDTVTITVVGTFASSTEYYVEIDATGYDDATSNSYAGITSKDTWKFTTNSPFTIPCVSSSSGINPSAPIGGITQGVSFTFYVGIPGDIQASSQGTWATTAGTNTTIVGGTLNSIAAWSPGTAGLISTANASTMTITITSFTYPNNSAGTSTYPGGNITVIDIP